MKMQNKEKSFIYYDIICVFCRKVLIYNVFWWLVWLNYMLSAVFSGDVKPWHEQTLLCQLEVWTPDLEGVLWWSVESESSGPPWIGLFRHTTRLLGQMAIWKVWKPWRRPFLNCICSERGHVVLHWLITTNYICILCSDKNCVEQPVNVSFSTSFPI